MKCNFQYKGTAEEHACGGLQEECWHCGISARELMLNGEKLEVCAEEFAYDIATGQRVLSPIALCPRCHAEHHQDARGHHNPCQILARRSRECLNL